MAQELDGLKFSAELSLTQEQVAKIIASFLTQQYGKTVLSEDVRFDIRSASDDRFHYTPASFTAKAKVSL